MSAIPSVCLTITWYFGLIIHPSATSIIGRSPWTQQSTFHHWSLTGWFPLCSMARHLFTLWDSCSVLDAISLIGRFLAFVSSFHHWLLFRGSISFTTFIWYMLKMHRVVGSWTCSSSDLHQIMKLLLYSSCWLMRNTLMLSFQWVSFHRLQLMYSGYET